MSGTQSTVLVAGAGPAGLTLAIDLVRRGIDVRVISSGSGPFPGSRAKGIQPRTLEVLDDLGVIEDIRASATTYPKLGIHVGPVTIKRAMIALHDVTEDVAHPNTLLAGQYDTDAALLRRLESLGGTVDFSTTLVDLRQDDKGVTASLEGPDGPEQAYAEYLVGADGGASAVRRALDIPFEGTTDEADRMIVADLEMTGLSRDVWHVWPRPRGRFMALCPMPGGGIFQLMLKIREGEPADMSPEGLMRSIRGFWGAGSVHVDAVRWSSVWRPNIRIARRYREGRVFLAGDAAHVHPPTGAQGLNTGVQDAYNLGWKLAQVLAGAPDSLLDSYEDERQPVAVGVLGLASKLYASTRTRPAAAMTRGDKERQLSLTYRGGPLALGVADAADGLQPGDRAPNLSWGDANGVDQRLIDHLRGPHFTLVQLCDAATPAANLDWPGGAAELRTVNLVDASAAHAAEMWGLVVPARVLIRPDGYVAHIWRGAETPAAADVAAFVPFEGTDR